MPGSGRQPLGPCIELLCMVLPVALGPRPALATPVLPGTHRASSGRSIGSAPTSQPPRMRGVGGRGCGRTGNRTAWSSAVGGWAGAPHASLRQRGQVSLTSPLDPGASMPNLPQPKTQDSGLASPTGPKIDAQPPHPRRGPCPASTPKTQNTGPASSPKEEIQGPCLASYP